MSVRGGGGGGGVNKFVILFKKWDKAWARKYEHGLNLD